MAWHLAGGFDNLEGGGWHRATIFRKVRRFRAAYGAHPDGFVFPWMQLDLDTAWSEQICRQIQAAPVEGSAGLDVKVHGAPPLHVRYQEVGMKDSGFGRVGGGT